MSKTQDARFYQEHADLCQVFSNAKRLKLLEVLKDGDEHTVSELQSRSDIPQSTISQHLQMMRDQGIVRRRKEGVRSYYAMTDDRFVTGMELMREVLMEREEG
ncbi:MAG: ArsR/SmtB family transcription factor [Halodesulfurarchaeum sp.]